MNTAFPRTDAFPSVNLLDDDDLHAHADRPHLIEYELATYVASGVDYDEHGPDAAERYSELSGMIESYAGENPDFEMLGRLFEEGVISADRAGEYAEILVLGPHVFEQYNVRSMKRLMSEFGRGDFGAGVTLALIADALDEVQGVVTSKRDRERVAKAMQVLGMV